MFSCKIFIVHCLTFRSLIHFEFIFVYGVREYFNFILLHVDIRFSQHHVLKRLSLLKVWCFLKHTDCGSGPGLPTCEIFGATCVFCASSTFSGVSAISPFSQMRKLKLGPNDLPKVVIVSK